MNPRKLLSANSELTAARADSIDFSQTTVSSANQQFFLLDYWRVLVKHRWLILASLVFMLAAAVLVSLRTMPMYRAVGQITVNRPNPNPLGLKEGSSTEAEYLDQNTDLATEVMILKSKTLALEARKLQLNENGEPKSSTANALGGLAVAVIPDTRVLQITCTSPDPRLAADAVNALINAYIEHNLQTRFEATSQAAKWLTKQLSDLQVKVDISEEKLVRYQKEHGIVGTDEKQNIITAKLDELNKEVTAAEADRIQKQAWYELTLSNDPDAISSVPRDPRAVSIPTHDPGPVSTVPQDALLQALRAQQGELKSQLAESSVRLGSAYPKVVELKNRLQQLDETINAELKRTASRIHNDYVAALGREKMLRQALDQQTHEANQLSENAIEYTSLKRDADSNRKLYDSLLQKLKEATLSAGLSSTNVHVLDLASLPRHPFTPNIPGNLGIGFLLGLFSGIALAFVLEVIDNTVSTPEQAETIASLPSLAVIPLAKDGLLRDANNGRRLLRSGRQNREKPRVFQPTAYTQPRSETAEAYRALRTSILLSSSDTPPKVILVTSPLPEEGKTTTSVNSAIVLAQEGRRVLLVDADLRRPSIDTVLGIKATAGLATVLTGNASAESAMIPSPQLPTLFVLPAGPRPPHPSELLGSARMKRLLAQWCEMFDYVIIDSPPALTVTDAVRLSVETHAVMLVVRPGHTSKGALRRTSTLFSQVNANVLGIVVNAIDMRSGSYYYHDYSGSKYAGDYFEAEEEASA